MPKSLVPLLSVPGLSGFRASITPVQQDQHRVSVFDPQGRFVASKVLTPGHAEAAHGPYERYDMDVFGHHSSQEHGAAFNATLQGHAPFHGAQALLDQEHGLTGKAGSLLAHRSRSSAGDVLHFMKARSGSLPEYVGRAILNRGGRHRFVGWEGSTGEGDLGAVPEKHRLAVAKAIGGAGYPSPAPPMAALTNASPERTIKSLRDQLRRWLLS